MKALQFDITIPRYIFAKALKTVFGNSVFYKGPAKTVRLVEISEPVLPSPDWVKIKTVSCGLCGSDLSLIRLHNSPTASPFTSFPCILGHEIVGRITEIGQRVQGFAPGDLVAIDPALGCVTRDIAPLCPACASGRPGNCANSARGSLPPGMFLGVNSGVNGGFAPYLVAHKSQLYKVPEGVSETAAVLTEPLAVAVQTLLDNLPQAGDKILVIGAGVIGNLLIQATRALQPDCHISVIEPGAFAAEFALRKGADNLIPHADVFAQTAAITGATIYKPLLGMEIAAGGFDKIYDTVGSAATLNLSLRLLTARGALSVVGIGGDVKLDLTPLWLKLQTIKGVYGYGFTTYRGKRRHVFEIALDLMAQNKVDAASLITHTFELDDYQQMLDVNLHKARHRAMKTIVSFTD